MSFVLILEASEVAWARTPLEINNNYLIILLEILTDSSSQWGMCPRMKVDYCRKLDLPSYSDSTQNRL